MPCEFLLLDVPRGSVVLELLLVHHLMVQPVEPLLLLPRFHLLSLFLSLMLHSVRSLMMLHFLHCPRHCLFMIHDRRHLLWSSISTR
jgi:hypothetical protein